MILCKFCLVWVLLLPNSSESIAWRPSVYFGGDSSTTNEREMKRNRHERREQICALISSSTPEQRGRGSTGDAVEWTLGLFHKINRSTILNTRTRCQLLLMRVIPLLTEGASWLFLWPSFLSHFSKNFCFSFFFLEIRILENEALFWQQIRVVEE